MPKVDEQAKDPSLILDSVQNVLTTLPWVKSINVIKTASMPVMKLECNNDMNSTRVDITVKDARHKGLECLKMVKRFIGFYPPLEKLLLTYKYILKVGGLNDPYYGGLSSYALLLLLVAFLQNKGIKNDKNLGQLFMQIMKFYAEFDFLNNQVCAQPPRKDSTKSPIFVPCKASDTPIVVDPLLTNPANNVSKCTYKMHVIQETLRMAYHSVWADCTCSLHKINSALSQPYQDSRILFMDKSHCLLSSIFGAVVAYKQSLNS